MQFNNLNHQILISASLSKRAWWCSVIPRTHQEAARFYHYDPFLRGSPQWATQKDLVARGYDENGDTFLGYGMAEHDRAAAFPITLQSEIHKIIRGGTRGKKGVSFIQPHCLTYHGTLIVLDDGVHHPIF